MGLIVDSSVFVAAERGDLDLAGRLADRDDEPVALAAISASELLHGVHRAASAVVKARREAFVERILASLEVIAFDEVVARVHARLWATLAAKGVNLGAHDLLIASTALSRDWSVATRDKRTFPKVPGLAVDLWE